MMKAKKAKGNRASKQSLRTMRERPKMPPISEEMKQWSVMYRGKKIFGGLPVTRGFDTPNSVILRFDPMPQDLEQRALKESRITPGKRWLSFEVQSTKDLRDALWWLNQAYERTK